MTLDLFPKILSFVIMFYQEDYVVSDLYTTEIHNIGFFEEVISIFVDKNYYSIGELSVICNIPKKTLRYYDETGLFTPDQRNEKNNYRFYSRQQIITLSIIKNLRQIGFSLKEIKEIIVINEAETLELNMTKQLDAMKEHIQYELKKYHECRYLLKKIQNGVDILNSTSKEIPHELKISVESVPKIQLLFDNQIMENYDYSQMSLDRWLGIMEKAEQSNCKISGSVFVTFYEENILNKFLSQDCQIEFAIQVDSTSTAADIRSFGDFDAATVIHIGNYEDIPNTYIQLIKWIKQNHYSIIGPATEEFILSPLDINDEARRVTKIMIPVQQV
jgi:DNA-binding transcriptional MerR regulator/effector-binding domain-containing protein